jgi:hypothetical protein
VRGKNRPARSGVANHNHKWGKGTGPELDKWKIQAMAMVQFAAELDLKK